MTFLLKSHVTCLRALLLGLCLSLLLSACSLASDSPAEETINLTLPCWPPQDSFSSSYPALSRWQIIIKSGKSEEDFYTTSTSLSIPVKKNRPFCLLAQPITVLSDGSESSFFKPAGFLYPTQIKPGQKENQISWEAGFLADVMKTYFNEGLAESLSPAEIEYLVSTFNWKKTQESIEKKISESDKFFYNPWLLSKAKILEGISALSFKASLLTASGCTGMESSLLPPGTFLSPFIPENNFIAQKNQFTVLKNTPVLFGDGHKYGIFITYKTSKNISLEFIYLPIYIEDI